MLILKFSDAKLQLEFKSIKDSYIQKLPVIRR